MVLNTNILLESTQLLTEEHNAFFPILVPSIPFKFGVDRNLNYS